jgi:hypothetical protein
VGEERGEGSRRRKVEKSGGRRRDCGKEDICSGVLESPKKK